MKRTDNIMGLGTITICSSYLGWLLYPHWIWFAIAVVAFIVTSITFLSNA